MANQKILILVEGEKADVSLMQHLLDVYQLALDYEIVSYCTNIYQLYHDLFELDAPDDIDLLQLLKSREKNPAKKPIFDYHYSDVFLVFDLDPQDPRYEPQKIEAMAHYFCESSDMGKLYINYPMVESFYHLISLPDPAYFQRTVTMEELQKKTYKRRVRSENYCRGYDRFAKTRIECNTVIKHHLQKAESLAGRRVDSPTPDQEPILAAQVKMLNDESKISVLSTCCFFIPDYQPALLEPDNE